MTRMAQMSIRRKPRQLPVKRLLRDYIHHVDDPSPEQLPTTPPTKEFKAGCVGGESEVIKRVVMNEMHDADVFVTGANWPGLSKGQQTNRDNVRDQVSIGDKLHVKTSDAKSYMTGIVKSLFRSISNADMLIGYSTLTEAAWGHHGGLQAEDRIVVCDVEWTKLQLTNEMKTYLNKGVNDGGGCTRQCGTLIPLA